MEPDNVAFVDVPEEVFPFTMKWYDATDRLVDEVTVEGPGAIHVKGWKNVEGVVLPVRCKVFDKNGKPADGE